LGAGIKGDVKATGRRIAKVAKSVAKSRVGQALAKSAIEHGAKKIEEHTGSALAGQVARMAGNKALDKIAGDGLISSAKRVVGRIARSKVGQSLGKMAINHGAKKIEEHTGSALAGQVARMAGNKVLEKAAGGDILGSLKKVGSTLGKGYGPVNPFNLGYDLGHDVIAPALMRGGDLGVGGRRVSFHDGEPLWRFAARRQSGGSFLPL
jgi:hypothetical protein